MRLSEATASEVATSTCARWASARSNIPRGVDPLSDPRFRHLHASKTVRFGRDAFAVIAARMEAYEIYPARIVQGKICSRSGKIEQGCTIVQMAGIGPVRLETAVRVVDVRRSGAAGHREYAFWYSTLGKHPEQGIIRFHASEQEGGARFAIDAWSRPGTWWSRLGRPFAAAWQRRANRLAVDFVVREEMHGSFPKR